MQPKVQLSGEAQNMYANFAQVSMLIDVFSD